jgi:hypothetical protein
MSNTGFQTVKLQCASLGPGPYSGLREGLGLRLEGTPAAGGCERLCSAVLTSWEAGVRSWPGPPEAGEKRRGHADRKAQR